MCVNFTIASVLTYKYIVDKSETFLITRFCTPRHILSKSCGIVINPSLKKTWLKSFWTLLKFPGSLESFLIIWKFSLHCGNFLDNLENFLTLMLPDAKKIVSIHSEMFSDTLECCWPFKNVLNLGWFGRSGNITTTITGVNMLNISDQKEF